MDWRSDMQGLADVDVSFGESLASKTSFRIGGPAECLAAPKTPEATAAVCALASQQAVPLMVLGGGTNVLVSDEGIAGIVMDLRPGFDFVREVARDDERVLWQVGAGAGTGRILRKALGEGLRGLEALSGVPGSIGGALIMNAGGHEGEIEESVERVQLVSDAGVRWIPKEEAGFRYRSSAFPKGSVVVAGEFSLTPADTSEIRARVKASLDRRKKTQPLSFPNAGSIFKNPEGDYAGRLIEAAGCKGWREGEAEVSELHANFIINTGGAQAVDVSRLARRVRDQVLEHSGVELKLEVKFLGHFEPEDRP